MILGWRWGYSTNLFGRAPPQGTTPYPFIHQFGRKGTLFHIPSLDIWYPFHMPSIWRSNPVNCCTKPWSFLDLSKQQTVSVSPFRFPIYSYTWSLKRYSFLAAPPHFGHYCDYPPPPPRQWVMNLKQRKINNIFIIFMYLNQNIAIMYL